MRKFYLLVLFVLSLTAPVLGQAREEYEFQSGVIEPDAVQIFPNPAIDYVHVKLDKIPVKNVRFSLHNIIGNEIPVETEVLGDNEIRIRVKDLVSGYYLIALKDDQDHFSRTFKFVKR